MENQNPKFTKEDLYNCWPFYEEYLIDILNKEYDLDQAIDDLRSLIGTKFDLRAQDTYEE